MIDNVDNKEMSAHILWWIFKQTAEDLCLTEEKIEQIKYHLEERIYGGKGNT